VTVVTISNGTRRLPTSLYVPAGKRPWPTVVFASGFQQAPGYYDQREHDRQARLDQIQADREDERNREAALEREKPREQGGVYMWRDTREARQRQLEQLREQDRRDEEARAAQERLLREEDARDAAERRLALQREHEDRLRARGQHEEDQRYQREDNVPREEENHGTTRSIDE